MISNEQSTATPDDKSNEQLYIDFAELIYDIYTDSQKAFEDENIESSVGKVKI